MTPGPGDSPSQAPALVRRGARAYQALRPARLGGESVWRSQEVRHLAWQEVVAGMWVRQRAGVWGGLTGRMFE